MSFKNAILTMAAISSSLCFAKSQFRSIHISDLETLMVHERNVGLYDANVESTRKNVGLIHGAHALSSYDQYAGSELPADKKSHLVFYCANAMCTASHVAAEHAVSLGYKDISVMVDGVYGWKQAGKRLDPYIASASENSDRPGDPKSAATVSKETSPVEAKKWLDGKTATLLDVREQEERHERISGAQWFPMSKVDTGDWTNLVKSLDKGKMIIVHCATGGRSKKVAEKLAQLGFHASYFKGPDQWKAAGLSVQAGESH